MVASINFYDATMTEARNKDGTHVVFEHVNRGEYTRQDGSPNPAAYKELQERFDQRVEHVHGLGRQIKNTNFSSMILNAGNALIDSGRLFICGHSLGGWTALLATFGD